MTLLTNTLIQVTQKIESTIYHGGQDNVNGDSFEKARSNSNRVARMSAPIARAVLFTKKSAFATHQDGYYLEMEEANGIRHNVLVVTKQSKNVLYHNKCDYHTHMGICPHMAQALMLMAWQENIGNVRSHSFWNDYDANVQRLLNGERVKEFELLVNEVHETFFDIQISTWSAGDLTISPKIQTDLSPEIFGRDGEFKMTLSSVNAQSAAQSATPSQSTSTGNQYMPDGDDGDGDPAEYQSFTGSSIAFPIHKSEIPDHLKPFIPEVGVSEYLQVDGEMDDLRDYIVDKLEAGSRPCVWVYGPPGTGKTFGAQCIAGQMQAPLIEVNCHDEMLEEHLLGNIHKQEDGSHKWVDGPVPEAFRSGSVLFMDEAHTIPTGLLTTLYPVTDGRKRFRIPYAPEEFQVVEAHPETIVIASANEGAGYKTYKGKFDPAWRDRWFTVKVDYLPVDQMAYLISKKTGFADRRILERMCETAETLRTMYEQRELEYICSTRTVEDWARAAKRKPPIEAAKRPLLDKLCTNDAQVTSVQNLLEQKFVG